jgi:intracellular sulfur oxidation DsrE/DsrF family protein
MCFTSPIVRLMAAISLLIGLAGIGTMVHAADKSGKPGVVIQISENNPAIWNLALNNAKNIQQEMGKDNVNIEIVAYGPGINMFKFDSEVGPRLTEANTDGIALLACGNTMKAQKLTEKDLDGNVKVVKAGVVEIINKQREGWAYIKP